MYIILFFSVWDGAGGGGGGEWKFIREDNIWWTLCTVTEEVVVYAMCRFGCVLRSIQSCAMLLVELPLTIVFAKQAWNTHGRILCFKVTNINMLTWTHADCIKHEMGTWKCPEWFIPLPPERHEFQTPRWKTTGLRNGICNAFKITRK